MSKVPLQDDPLYGLAASALASWRSTECLAELLVHEANNENEAVRRWLDPLIEKGPTRALLLALSDEVFDVEIPHYQTIDRKTLKFRWALRGKMSKKATEAFRKAGPALAIIRVVNADFANRLHRCELEDCRKYFTGDPRSRWCSTTCGSKYRQRKFRKERQ